MSPNVNSVYRCIRPVLRTVSIPTNAAKDLSGRYINHKKVTMPVACGHCAGCRLLRSRQWATRLAWTDYYNKDNAKRHSYFITFTFNNAVINNGVDNSAEKATYKELQKLFKRLRKGSTYLPALKFSYYVAGEFGEQFGRFHYHVLLNIEDNTLIPEWLDKFGRLKGLGLEFRDVLQDDGLTRQLSLHWISSAKNKEKRLQTPQEATLSFILQNFYWPLGHVSCGSADTNGGLHYITKTLRYVTKGQCNLKEVEDCKCRDFHRQSLYMGCKFTRIGRKYIVHQFCGLTPEKIYKGGEDAHIVATNPYNIGKDKCAIVPIPRYWFHKFCNDVKRIEKLPFIISKMCDEFGQNELFVPLDRLKVRPDNSDVLGLKSSFSCEYSEDLPYFSNYENKFSEEDLPLWTLC